MLFGFPLRVTVTTLNKHANIIRALAGSELAHDEATVYARELELPSGGGVGTARALAHAYSVFATDGQPLHLLPATLRALAEHAIAPTHGFYDECMKGEIQYSLGFMKSSPTWPFGGSRSFGAPGSGGSLGFADPDAGIGYGYVTSQMGTSLTGDPRDVALRHAVYASIGVAA
jgi:CubicO group peptidase (beta-lactamase class C family)